MQSAGAGDDAIVAALEFGCENKTIALGLRWLQLLEVLRVPSLEPSSSTII